MYLTNLVVDHRGSFSDVPLTLTGPSFVDYLLSIVNADCIVQVIGPPGDDLEGVAQLPCPPQPPTTPELKVHFRATPTPLKGKGASSEQSVEGPEAKAQPSMATLATQEDTSPKTSQPICGEWRKVPGSYPKDASG